MPMIPRIPMMTRTMEMPRRTPQSDRLNLRRWSRFRLRCDDHSVYDVPSPRGSCNRKQGSRIVKQSNNFHNTPRMGNDLVTNQIKSCTVSKTSMASDSVEMPTAAEKLLAGGVEWQTAQSCSGDEREPSKVYRGLHKHEISAIIRLISRKGQGRRGMAIVSFLPI